MTDSDYSNDQFHSWWDASVLLKPEYLSEVGSWHGHIPFAFWIIAAHRPRTFVELGTHYGDSYFAFCQSIANQHIETQSFAVDTWKGDEHAGFYEEHVYETFISHHDSRYVNFSIPLRMFFKEALDRFGDGTIDLLHIDGYHTYDAVSSDFELWLPKLSNAGIVLFHDISVRTSDFGVWRFWEEASKRFPSISFSHSNGLGVLFTGDNRTEKTQALLAAYGSSPATITELFATFGERVMLLGESKRNSRSLETIQNLLDESEYLRAQLSSALTEQKHEVEVLTRSFEDQANIMKKQRANEDRLQHDLEVSLATADEVLSSETWRATAPLRRSIALTRRVLGWQRYFAPPEPRLMPVHGVAPSPMTDNGSDVALGGRIRYQLGIDRLFPGWYELRFSLNSSPESPLDQVRPYVITRTFNGHYYSQAIAASIGSDGTIRIPFHVNKESKSWDLLLINLGGPYKLDHAKITAIATSANVAAKLATRLFRFPALPSHVDPNSPLQKYLPQEEPYSRWIEESSVDCEQVSAYPHRQEQLSSQPLISIVMPVYNNKIAHIIQAIESVRAQTYPKWELCIADDASTQEGIVPLIENYAAHDSRIKFFRRQQNGGISACSNTALELATGDWVGFLDADDELSQSCLKYYAAEVSNHPNLELVFCDEDKILETGDRVNPYFKPSLSPALLLGKNMVTHFAVYKKTLLDDLGGLRSEFDGAQDWDLVLRLIARDPFATTRSKRIPRVLYHWRLHPTSVSSGVEAKAWAVSSGEAAVKDYLKNLPFGDQATVQAKNVYIDVLLSPPFQSPKASILIATSGQYNIISQCLDALERFGLPDNAEIHVMVDSSSDADPEGLAFLTKWLSSDPNHRSFTVSNRHGAPFNYSRTINALAREARGEYLVLLNDDVLVRQNHWLETILATFQLPRVQVVGVHLLFPNGAIQHAGVTIGPAGMAGHAYKGSDPEDLGYYSDLKFYRNVSAVTAACLAISRETFFEVGGLDEYALPVAFNDTDLCLKVLKTGGLIVQNPHVRMIHDESSSRGSDAAPRHLERVALEVKTFQERWASYIGNDPYFNPNLDVNLPYPTPKYCSRRDDGL